MTITVELPDDLATRPNAGRELLEATAIEGYRSEALTHHQAAALVGMDRFEFESLLKRKNVMDHAYDSADLLHDIQVMDRLDRSGLLGR